MRSLTLSVLLLAGVATGARAQGAGITAPITKARAAAAAADARTAAQTVNQDAPPPRDSVTVANAPTQTAQKPAAVRPPVPRPAPAKPDTASVKTAIAPTPSAPTSVATDTGKRAASGKSVTTTSTPGTDKSAAPVAPPQVAPGKGAPVGGKPSTPTPPATSGTKTDPVTPASGKPSATAGAAPADAPPPTSVSSTPAMRAEIAINREIFQYDAAGRRDPFASLLASSDLRPLFSDLLLVVINYDPQGRNSVAIMRDAATKEQYRVRQGQLIGRMRVAAIEPKRVMFTIDEFGFSRQESLVIGDTTKVRKQ